MGNGGAQPNRMTRAGGISGMPSPARQCLAGAASYSAISALPQAARGSSAAMIAEPAMKFGDSES